MRRSAGTLMVAVVLLAVAGGVPAHAAQVSRDMRVTASDGVSLQTTLTGEGSLARRPTIVEFSPYGRNSGTFKPGPRYNFLLVQIRGTGDSDGSFDALGPRTQADVAEVLRWACGQPWSNGRLGINGFSASAITIYNSLHRKLPCVKTAVLKSGTFELYRDLLVPGGVNNIVPGTGVLALIGAPAAAQGFDRLGRSPGSSLDVIRGLFGAGLSDLLHPTLDAWWRERGFRGDVNHLPVLMIDGFFDVESRGAFQAFQALRGDGAHLMVIGAHDGAPKGTDGGTAETARWFDRYLAGVRNRVERKPRVQMWLSDGDREDYLAGKFVHRNARDWPPPGTRWRSWALDSKRSGTASSLNDGSLSRSMPARATTQRYPAVPSLPTSSDPFNTAIVGGFGPNQLAVAFPVLTEMKLAEPAALTYTTKPFASDSLSVGPASLEVRLSSTAPETSIWAVLSDVAKDGSAHPLTAGRLLSSFPQIDDRRSLHDGRNVVQPYGRFDRKQAAAPGSSRTYRVELWPLGNRFRAGHRLRLDVLGGSAASAPGAPALNSVTIGGRNGSRLLVPILGRADSAAGRCLARRSPVGPRNVGRVRLGYSRRRALRRVRPRPVRRARYVYRWCAKRSRGRVTAVFSRRSARGRVLLVVTTARGHGMRGVRPGIRIRRLRARFPHRRRLARGLYSAGPRSRRLFGVRRGKVRFVAVADRKLIHDRRALRRYLHRAGL